MWFFIIKELKVIENRTIFYENAMVPRELLAIISHIIFNNTALRLYNEKERI